MAADLNHIPKYFMDNNSISGFDDLEDSIISNAESNHQTYTKCICTAGKEESAITWGTISLLAGNWTCVEEMT